MNEVGEIVEYICDKLADSTADVNKGDYQEILKDLIEEFKVRLKASQEDE